MKRVRVEITPDPALAPTAFLLLADSPGIVEARLVELNLGGVTGPTMLFTIEGNHDGLAAALRLQPAVRRVEATSVTERRATLLVVLSPAEVPIAAALFEAFSQAGLVVELPVVYRSGTVHATILGEAEALQGVLDKLPDGVRVDVREVAGVAEPDPAPTLSDRQREAVLAALDLGYYDVPRGATHEAVAEQLGVSPSTASEHLQKAEAKLVRAGMAREEKPITRSS